MVISNKYNFVFLRIPKNASTSLATWFVKNCCDENDRYTQIGDSGIKNTNIEDRVIKKHRTQYHFIHMTLQEIVDDEVLDRNELQSKEVFGIIRNPYHRQLSLFFFLPGEKNPHRFREIFKNGYHETDVSNKILQSDYLKLDDQIVGNAWNYLNINEHLNNFMKEKQIEEKFPLMQYKSNKKPKDMHALEIEYYDEKTRRAVYEYYEEDFKLLNRCKK